MCVCVGGVLVGGREKQFSLSYPGCIVKMLQCTKRLLQTCFPRMPGYAGEQKGRYGADGYQGNFWEGGREGGRAEQLPSGFPEVRWKDEWKFIQRLPGSSKFSRQTVWGCYFCKGTPQALMG